VCASIGLVVLTPLFVMIGIAIKLTSDGSVFYKQTRIGKDFQPFTLLKFRSMIPHADQSGLHITSKHDSRITPIGTVLRQTKLDELPQLINVIRGDLSIVGPRPEVEKYVMLYKTEYTNILKIKPGITDNAAIAFFDEAAILAASEHTELTYINDVLPQKIKLYNQYIHIMSFATDIKIIFKTLLKIVKH
jgi:lipopolysaccharide/colanic/teichoic acid biosynthesis glycosyltransferase